ncbi:MAG TPA: endoribonuclease MazF [Vineibacter sp.]|nr:endoribonuclease MazF [Vineibacter sp.]
MPRAPYVPGRGDIIWLDFNPQAGHEQAGRRPALVLSPRSYNAKVGLMVCCPVTTKIKGYPFEVALSGAPASAVLSDQVKRRDWRTRGASKKGAASAIELAQVLGLVRALLSL